MDLKQIITLHKDGVSNRQIGELLGISRNTVNSYIKQARGSDHSFDELLAIGSGRLDELFTAHTTVKNDRYNQLMVYFDRINQQRNHPGFTFSYHYLENRYGASLSTRVALSLFLLCACFFAGIALTWHFNETGIHHFAFIGKNPGCIKGFVKGFE